MNKTFKVVFNKARGSLMAANETTSSVQAKGTKTVVAAAVTGVMAAAAGAAFAADEPAVDANLWQDKVITEDVTIDQAVTVNSAVLESGTITANKAGVEYDRDNSKGDFTMKGGKVVVNPGLAFSVRDFVMEGGAIEANGTELVDDAHGRTLPAFGAYNSFVMNAGDVALSKGGRIWIGTSNKNNPESYNRLVLQGGTVSLKDGGYITTNKRYIKAGEYYPDADGVPTVTVKEDTLGYNTVGFDGAAVSIEGQGNVIDSVVVEVTGGTLAVKEGAELTLRATTATNETNVDGAAQKIGELANLAVKGGSVENAGKIAFAENVKNFSLEDGSFTNAATGELNVTTVTVSGGTLKNEGNLFTETLTVKGGTVDTVYQPYNELRNFTATTVNLEGGVLNLAALNSKSDTSLEANDQLLLNYGTYNLAGGELQVAGQEYEGALKVGRSADRVDLNVTGDYAFSKVSFGSSNKTDKSVLTVGSADKAGSLTVGTLDFTTGDVKVQNGTLTADELVWNVPEGTSWNKKGELTVAEQGTLATQGKNIFVQVDQPAETAGEETGGTEAQPAEKAWALNSDLLSHMTVDGTLIIADEFEGTVEQIVAAQDLLAENGIDTVIFKGVKYVPNADGKFEFDKSTGQALVTQEVTAPASVDGAVSLDTGAGKVGIGTLAVDKDTKTVTVANAVAGDQAGTLVIGGTEKGGNVVNGVEKLDSFTAEKLELGYEVAQDSAANVVNADNLVAGSLTVKGNWAATNVAADVANVTTGSAFTVKTVASGVTTVGGTLTANQVAKDAEVTVAEGGTLVLGERLTAPKAETETAVIFADFGATTEPATPAEPELLAQVSGTVTANAANAVVGTSADARAKLLAAAGDKFDAKKSAGLYVDNTIAVGQQGSLTVGNGEASNGTVALGENAVAVVDLNAFKADQAVFVANQVNVENGAQVVLQGADKRGEHLLVEGGHFDFESNEQADEVLGLANHFFAADVESRKDGNSYLVVDVNEALGLTKVGQVVSNVLVNQEGSQNAAVMNAIGNNAGYFEAKSGLLNAAGEQVVSEYVTLPVVSGVYNAAYDGMNAFTGAVQNRAVEAGKSFGVWANAYYASNEAKTLYGASGYDGDVYGGVLGADATFSCGARVGAALTLGNADYDSKNTVNAFNTDSDFWGLSVYAAKDFDGLNVAADLSYLAFDNDLMGSVAGVKADESLDSSAFTFGVTAQKAFAVSDSFALVPHAGLRLAQVKVDDYRGFESGDLNVFEVPLGVTVKGSFEQNGWKVAPFADFTATAQLGDKEVSTVLGDQNVLGNVYAAKLGVEAQVKDVTFGAAFSYGFGSDDRANTAFSLKAAYNF